MFGSTITIKSTGNDPIQVHGFWKKEAKEIKALCSKQINAYNQRISHTGSTSNFSVADEISKLKDLFNEGELSREEFEQQKRRLLQ